MKITTDTFVIRAALALVAVVALSSRLEAAPIYSSVVMADTPDAYWRLGETSGTTAIDQTGNHNGTYSATYVQGQVGAIVNDSNTAVDFSSGLVNATGTGIGGTTALSIEMWVTADTLSLYNTLLMRTTSLAWNDGFGIYYQDTGSTQLQFFINGYASPRVGAVFNTTSTYSHIVATYLGGQAGSGNLMSIYVDGILAGSLNTTTSSINYGVGANLYIGQSVGNYGFWDGKIDEVSIYSTVLTAGDVAEHYAAGISPVPEPSSAFLFLAGCLAFFMVRKRHMMRNPVSIL